MDHSRFAMSAEAQPFPRLRPGRQMEVMGDAGETGGMSHNADFVSFRGVTKAYGPVQAVAGLDLGIAKGESLPFLRPSGSGKTTSLMMLAGFEPPTTGDITFDGRALRAVPPYRRDI